jgi:hypothetical protein
MNIAVTLPVRNEGWVLGLTARAMLMWADTLVILDHASIDNTPDIIREVAAENPGRVVAIRENDPTWFEMSHRQRLLDAARANGATHIAMVDADEVISGNILPYMRDYFAETDRRLLQFPWLCCWRGISHYRDGDSSAWSRSLVSAGFQDSSDLHWKAREGYDFHHRHPMGRDQAPYVPVRRPEGGLLHLQHASWRRLLAKQALYQMIEVLRWPGRNRPEEIAAMYGGTVDETGINRSVIPASWWLPYAPLMGLLDVDAEPWQEAQCRALIAEHGRQRFAGLNLFGVV